MVTPKPDGQCPSPMVINVGMDTKSNGHAKGPRSQKNVIFVMPCYDNAKIFVMSI